MSSESSRRSSKGSSLYLFGGALLSLVTLILCVSSYSYSAPLSELAAQDHVLLSRGQEPHELSKRTVTASYAQTRMLGNIGGALGGSANQVPGAQTGAVIASPSTASPDYYFSWIRDAALTMKVAINFSNLNRTLVENWAAAEKVHQKNAGSSSYTQGEPKFNPDGSLFTGPWGRPQNDGPALRASAFMAYANRIGLSDPFVTNTLYKSDLNAGSLIKTDLEYVAHHWQDSSFDLWEEVQGTHFFTLMAQWRSMVDGAAFATKMNDPGASSYYSQQATAIANKLQSFWDSGAGRVQAYQGVGGRSGIDCSVLLGSLRGWNSKDIASGVDNTKFGPASDKILATHKQYVDAFRNLYAINKNAAAPSAVGTGRYPEDVYNGVGTSQGNPWFLCTNAASELLYTSLDIYQSQGKLDVTTISQPFFRQFSSSISTGSYPSSSTQYVSLTKGMKAMADGFVDIVNTHAWPNGSIAEEFDRNTGYNTGARDLTWSYAAFLTSNYAAAGNPIV
ncbi:hypothetical protein IE53DRAFT_320361 [Violaceomyces palustris]|uniref:Uncharacterized protein n=1 Tax=Violaceomyces palustris TaxID=1673888 RepID=A0ACD0NQ45_9BASI|nr:hypothetical protein IE53DRAFT_320361 [Violaceomyces palustris]